VPELQKGPIFGNKMNSIHFIISMPILNLFENERMMKKVFLFYVFSLLINLTINSQSAQSEISISKISAVSGERISLFTDRNIYCVKEKIYFTAEYSFSGELDSLAWSNVLYVELIRWNGNKLAQIKLKLTRPVTSGILNIPADILSGNYYLRAYTKWMRNFSAGDYAYQLVKIVNPFRPETDEGPSETLAPATAAALSLVHKKMINGVNCTLVKNEYKQREKAEVEVQIKDQKFFDVDRYYVSVAKVGAIDTAVQSCKPESTLRESNLSYIEYLPEIRGITITGKIIDNSTKLSQKDIYVSLSEPKHGEYFSVYKTNDRGRFVFSLPFMEGSDDFFIQSESAGSMSSEILIDNGYCSKPVNLPYVAFKLSEEEGHFIKANVIDMQLTGRFLQNKDTLAETPHTGSETIPFYGSKKTVYNTGKYIELPNVEEFISEIILEATIIKEKGKASFISMKREDMSISRPLIFLDNVQVNNDGQLIKIPLSRIERVEVINADYIVSGMKYYGIISIYSKNKDFAGLDLNKNSMFFTYELFSDTNQGFDYSKRSDNSRIPDRRNLLYWNPDIKLSADKKSTISFYTSDSKGEYIVYIRGKNSKDDSEIYGKCNFLVK
jgi:hypothetical protein